MRVQVYEEEIGDGIEIIERVSENGEYFYGLRVWLKTCQPLLDHSTSDDDDRSAVTFWARSVQSFIDMADQIELALRQF